MPTVLSAGATSARQQHVHRAIGAVAVAVGGLRQCELGASGRRRLIELREDRPQHRFARVRSGMNHCYQRGARARGAVRHDWGQTPCQHRGREPMGRRSAATNDDRSQQIADVGTLRRRVRRQHVDQRRRHRSVGRNEIDESCRHGGVNEATRCTKQCHESRRHFWNE